MVMERAFVPFFNETFDNLENGEITMAEYTFVNRANDMKALGEYLVSQYRINDWETQLLDFGDSMLFQCRNTKSGGAGSFLGALTGLNVLATLRLERCGSDLHITSAGGKWLDKSAVIGVSMFILWPLFVTSLIGMGRQRALVDEVYNKALAYMNNRK